MGRKHAPAIMPSGAAHGTKDRPSVIHPVARVTCTLASGCDIRSANMELKIADIRAAILNLRPPQTTLATKNEDTCSGSLSDSCVFRVARLQCLHVLQ